MSDKVKNNLRVLVDILINGEHVATGTVVSKDDFKNKGDWQNLVFAFDPPRMEETSDAVGAPEAIPAATTKAKLPGQ